MEGVAVMSIDDTALDLIKQMLPQEKAIRVVEYALRNNRDEDDPVFFFMAMFETSGRVLLKISDSIGAQQRACDAYQEKMTRIHQECQTACASHKDDVQKMVTLSQKTVGQQAEALLRLQIAAENLGKRLSRLETDISRVDKVWQGLSDSMSNKAAYVMTTQTFTTWFSNHSMWFATEASDMLNNLVARHLWIAYVVGGTLAFVNIVAMILLIFRKG
jgi:hypothetical protein